MKDPVQERIEREIVENDVVLFMKGAPVCSKPANSLNRWRPAA